MLSTCKVKVIVHLLELYYLYIKNNILYILKATKFGIELVLIHKLDKLNLIIHLLNLLGFNN